MPNGYLPIKRNGNQCEYGCSDRHIAHEIVHRTIDSAKWPIRIQHIDEIEHTI